MVAAVNLNIFHKHCDRVKMTSVAQMVNVLQAMVLTRGNEMVLTPTYYVFKNVFRASGRLTAPVDLQCELIPTGRQYQPSAHPRQGDKKAGSISPSRTSTEKALDLRCELKGATGAKLSGEIITAATMNAYNDFGKPEAVSIKPFTGAQLRNGILTVSIPAKSIVTLEVN